MLLAVDVGNTNITLGIYSEETLKLTARLSTDSKRTSDQYSVELRGILDINGISFNDINKAIICSVVPSVGKAVYEAIVKLCKIKPIVLGPGIKTGLNIKIDNPAQLGADLVAGAVGAINQYKMPCIIIDMGTATTISVLDKDGAFIGGAISAGVRLTLDALTTRTAQLPQVGIEEPSSVIGTNTVDCMKSGLILGTASMIDGMIKKIEKQLGCNATKVATGGLSKEVISKSDYSIDYNDNLLLEGLRIIYNKNK